MKLLFIRILNGKLLIWLFLGEWIEKVWYGYNEILIGNRNEIIIYIIIRMKFENNCK